MKFKSLKKQLDFQDVLIAPRNSKIFSRNEVALNTEYRKLKAIEYDGHFFAPGGYPITTSNMATVGTIKFAQKMLDHGCFACLHKHLKAKDVAKFINNLHPLKAINLFVSIGLRDADLTYLDDIVHIVEGKDFMVHVDCANGYMKEITKIIKKVRKIYPGCLGIMAGNVCDVKGAKALYKVGADIVKINIGAGSVCLTREKTGVGRPQLSALLEVCKYAHRHHKYVCADGGMNTTGDFCKALVAGADLLMSGSLFAGCIEADDGYIVKSGKKLFKRYFGMASEYAQNKYNGGISGNRTSEGRNCLIPVTGHIYEVLGDLIGGLASCCAYIGASEIEDMSKCGKFYLVNHQLNTMFAEK